MKNLAGADKEMIKIGSGAMEQASLRQDYQERRGRTMQAGE
jgi:hypothetical protein